MFELSTYKNLLGLMESGNDYHAVNGLSGALGKFQFMPTTLNALRNKFALTDWINAATFLNNPSLQNLYIDTLIKDTNDAIESNNLNLHIGRIVTGSKRFSNVTAPLSIYGLLAAVHLSGLGNVIQYFYTGHDPNDGQTSLTDYMAYFSNKLKSNAIAAGIGLSPGSENLFLIAGLAFVVFYALSLR